MRLAERLRQSAWAQFVIIHVVVIGAPVLIIVGAGPASEGLRRGLQMAVSLAFIFTSGLILAEGLMSVRRRRGPGLHGQRTGRARDLTVILVAYLPNEQDVIISSALAVLENLEHPTDRLQLIVAYNTPDDLPVEADLHELARTHEPIEVLRVHGSTSKAENLIAAIGHARGSVTAIIDSDHRLHPLAAQRALRWFDEGYDIVQGRCVIRNGDESLLARLVSIEFEQIYGLAHAGRSLLMDTAIFGGANGWWRTGVLRRLGFDKTMLTEDIDSSMRAMLSGFKIIHDRSVMSTELAPTSWGAWWKQRTRWAQGWLQVTMRHQSLIVSSKELSWALKAYWSVLLTWRELFPIIAAQIVTLILSDVILTGNVTIEADPLSFLSLFLTIASGCITAWATWRLSTPETRETHGPWRYAMFGLGASFYTLIKNTVALVALAREALGDHRWVVTARTKTPSGSAASAASTAAVTVLAAGALAAGSSALHPEAASAATATTATLPLVTATDGPTTLNSTTTQNTWSLAVPGMWTSVSGDLTLRLNGASQLSSQSRIAVTVNGQQIAAGIAQPGSRTINVPLSGIATPAHTLQVVVATTLRTTLNPCPPPGDPTATMQLLPGSELRLTGSVNRKPALGDAPGILVDALGTNSGRVGVRFRHGATASAIQAAGVAAGAISTARGYPGVHVHAAGPDERATLLIDDRPGASRLRLSVRDARPTLTISGHGDALVKAALALTDGSLRHRHGASVTNPVGHLAARKDLPDVIQLGGSTQTTAGTATATSTFTIPGRYEVRRGARLRLNGTVESPSSTRTSIKINGRSLLSRVSDTTGLPIRIDTILAGRGPAYLAGDLRPGQNAIEVKASSIGAPRTCVTQATITSTIDPTGSLHLISQARPVDEASLATWPFPLDGAANWTGSDLALPASPSPREVATAVSVLADAQRTTGEPALPRIIDTGAIASPSRPTLVLARPGAVPVALSAQVEGGAPSGTLSVLRSGPGVVLAVGDGALDPLTGGYSPELLNAVTVDVRGGQISVRQDDTAIVTATKALPGHIRWPLLLLGFSIAALFLLSMKNTRSRILNAAPVALTSPREG